MRKLICKLSTLIDQQNIQNAEAGSPRLNQSVLSAETGIAGSTLSRLYRSEFTRVDVNTIETLCEYFQCDVCDLLSIKEMPNDG